MKKFKVLGTGCTKCKTTALLLETAAAELGQTISVEKIEDPMQIISYGVMSTPSVVLDETVVHKGGLPSTAEIQQWLTS